MSEDSPISNVTKLPFVQAPVSDDNRHMVTAMESIVLRIRSGDILGIAVAFVSKDKDTSIGCFGRPPADLIVAAVSRLNYKINQASFPVDEKKP